MRKILLGFYFFNCVFGKIVAQVYSGQVSASKIPEPQPHYLTEYTFDTTLNVAAWTKQKAGMHVSFGSTDKLYFRSEVPDIDNVSLSFNETGWKGERLNMQIQVWSPDTLNQVRFSVSDLKSAKGKVLSQKNISLNLVRYVIGNYPYGAKDATCGSSNYKDLYLMPDRFEAFDRFDLPGKTVRPIWLALDIPANAEAGDYNGTIEVRSEKYKQVLNLKITVQNQVLPRPYEWKHRLDLWQNPWVVARFNHLQPWSEEHKVLLKHHLKLYADAGGKYITTYGVHSPWSDNEYAIEEGMIEWIKTKNGPWKFDYNIFDQYVQLAMEVGIDKAITIYSPVPWGFRFRYLDESTGNYLYDTWAPDSPEFRKFWNIFLTDLQKHLEKKGWFEKTYLGINENAMDQTLAAIKMVRDHSKKWKITYAGDWHKELEYLLDDYCFLYGKESDVDVVNARAAKGFTTTYYVCCNPPVPNNFIFSPPIEGRWISWYTAAHHYDGFLRWAYDAWTADPSRDARHTAWPAGDSYLIYPGGQSGIRFEKLREGIVDFEKIRILREKAAKSTDGNIKMLMKQLEQHLETFLSEKDFNTEKITEALRKGRKMVETLSDLLAGKKTQPVASN